MNPVEACLCVLALRAFYGNYLLKLTRGEVSGGQQCCDNKAWSQVSHGRTKEISQLDASPNHRGTAHERRLRIKPADDAVEIAVVERLDVPLDHGGDAGYLHVRPQ